MRYIFHITTGSLASTGEKIITMMRDMGSLSPNKAHWQQQVSMGLFYMAFFRHVSVGSYSSWPELLASTVPVGTGLRPEPAPILHLPFPTWHTSWVAAGWKSEWGLLREFSFKGEFKPKLKWQYKYINQNVSFQPKVFKSLLPSCYFQRKCLMETWDSTQNIWLAEMTSGNSSFSYYWSMCICIRY